MIPAGIITTVLTLASLWIGSHTPLDSVTVSVLLSITVSTILPSLATYDKPLKRMESPLLAAAISLMGFGLNWHILGQTGTMPLIVGLTSVGFTLFVTYLLILKNPEARELILLTGGGTAICGSSAIAAISGVTKPSDSSVAASIASVNILGTVGMLAFPFLLEMLPLPDLAHAIITGASLQSVGQVSGAAAAMPEAPLALLVKMIRILTLMPVLLILEKSHQTQMPGKKTHLLRSVPLFIPLFILASLLSTGGLLNERALDVLHSIGKVLLTAAVAAMGSRIRLGQLKATATSALHYAGVIWILQIGWNISISLILFSK